jgi:hypothetical protein
MAGTSLGDVIDRAAEVLGLPFSTYRRHLARAIDEVTEALWSVEIGTSPKTPAGSTSK